MTLPFVPKLTKGMAAEKVAAMMDAVYVRCPTVSLTVRACPHDGMP